MNRRRERRGVGGSGDKRRRYDGEGRWWRESVEEERDPKKHVCTDRYIHGQVHTWSCSCAAETTLLYKVLYIQLGYNSYNIVRHLPQEYLTLPTHTNCH